MNQQPETTSQPQSFYRPCARCGRNNSQSPLKLDRSGKFHICSDALSCLRTIKAQGFHTYIHGTASATARGLACVLADERGIDLAAFISTELELDSLLKVSQKALSAIIDGIMQRQIKAQRAA